MLLCMVIVMLMLQVMRMLFSTMRKQNPGKDNRELLAPSLLAPKRHETLLAPKRTLTNKRTFQPCTRPTSPGVGETKRHVVNGLKKHIKKSTGRNMAESQMNPNCGSHYIDETELDCESGKSGCSNSVATTLG